MMRTVLLSVGIAGLLLADPNLAASSPSLVERGRYLFGAAGGCLGCHTIKGGEPLAGGREHTGFFGTVYSTNITPDRETGIGTWSDAEIIAAIRHGVRPSGKRLLPVMPYPAYAGMAEEDMRALLAFLRSVDPVHQPNRKPALRIPFLRKTLGLWNWLYVPTVVAPERPPASGIARGEYLVRHITTCGECHTPRGRFTGAPDRDRFLAGSPAGPVSPDGARIPNITPHPEAGIGNWTVTEIADFLRSGLKPNGDTVEGLMADVIFGKEGGPGLKDLSQADALAIAQFLKTVRPIRERVPR
ncbi:MAG: c-type cytochrome [Candidatus Methylomirabilales bacterium]